MVDEQWMGINLGNVPKGPSLAVSVWTSNPWKDLWLEWFKEDGDPLYDGGEWDECCFFCGQYQTSINESRHDENCIYLRAKQLIESETAVITTTAGVATNG